MKPADAPLSNHAGLSKQTEPPLLRLVGEDVAEILDIGRRVEQVKIRSAEKAEWRKQGEAIVLAQYKNTKLGHAQWIDRLCQLLDNDVRSVVQIGIQALACQLGADQAKRTGTRRRFLVLLSFSANQKRHRSVAQLSNPCGLLRVARTFDSHLKEWRKEVFLEG